MTNSSFPAGPAGRKPADIESAATHARATPTCSALDDAELEPERYELSQPLAYRFVPSRRDFLKTLGGGLLVALVVGSRGASARAAGPGSRLTAVDPLSAWIHVGRDDTVTIFAGKAEIGQDIRTAFAQVLVEELPMELDNVRVVLGDTQMCPYDRGTFGSMSTPRVSPQIRKVGATTRTVLQRMAAEAWGIAVDDVVVEPGQLVESGGSRTISFGELVAGQMLSAEIDEGIATKPASEWKVAGTSQTKAAGPDMVTGRHRYTSDLRPEGVLHGLVLRPPSFEATLETADLSSAQAMPGVTAVHDGQFVGVAAPDPHTAERALSSIEATWRERRAHPDPSELDRSLRSMPASAGRGRHPAPVDIVHGEGRRAIDRANRIVEATYTTPYIAHVPLEPRSACVQWQGESLDAWVATQTPFSAHADLAESFGLQDADVSVRVADTGSGYGGKTRVSTGLEAARLAKAAGAPVNVQWSREEEFTWAYFRPPASIDMRLGLDSNGRIMAWSQTTHNAGSTSMVCNYDVAHQALRFQPGAPPLEQGSYRAVGATANNFASESAVDEAALAAGLDPLEYRLDQLSDARLIAVLERAAEDIGWGRAPGQGRALGIAACRDKGGYIANAVELAVADDGQVELLRICVAADVGAMINPAIVRGQIEGSVIMGLGGALFEEISYADGKILNPRLSAYRVPRFSDVPEIEVEMLDTRSESSAGAGEVGIVAIAPAIANAIAAASGERIRSLPLLSQGKIAL